jgi:hypothetical protein
MKFFAIQKKNGKLIMLDEFVDIEDSLGIGSYNGILVADKKTLRGILREHFNDSKNKNFKIVGIEVTILVELQEEYTDEEEEE